MTQPELGSTFKNKKVLVAGGTGMVGQQLTRLLLGHGAKVRIASMDHPDLAHPEAEFIKADLTDYMNCVTACKDMDYVFNLLCVKGSPTLTKRYPARFFDNVLLLSINLARAAFRDGVNGFLYASSVAVYQPQEILREDDVWKTLPSEHDWYAGHAKRAGELQIEAYRIEHDWINTAIVRPSNVYGPYDVFDPKSSLFMASMIRKFAEKQNPITVWGDGSQIRDFIHAKDAARGMILAAEKSAGPVNLCSGRETTVREVVEILTKNSDYHPEIIYDTTKPTGDQRRILDVTRLKALGFEPQVSLEEGLRETTKWYLENKGDKKNRFDPFV